MKTLQVFKVALFVLGAYSHELFDIEFVKCPSNPRATIIYALGTGSSTTKCVNMCVNRPWCKAALFHRKSFVCHAVLVGDPVLFGTETHSHDNGTTCLLLRKDKLVDGLKQVRVNIHINNTFCSMNCRCLLCVLI